MTRTAGRYDGDTSHQDGSIPLLPGADIVAVVGTAAMTRVIAGEFSLRTSQATTAYTFFGGISSMVYRTGEQDFLQEQFGSTRAGGAQGLPIASPQTLSTGSIVAGSNVTINVLSSVEFQAGQSITLDTVASGVQEFTFVASVPNATSIIVTTVKNAHTTPFPISANLFTTPAQNSGIPPFTGITELTPQTTFRPKGILFESLTVIYAVNTTAITVPTVGLFTTQYQNLVAPLVTFLIPQATNGLPVAAAAQPYVIPIPVPIANQNFIVTPNTVVGVEFDFTTGGSGTVDVLGFILTCKFNYA